MIARVVSVVVVADVDVEEAVADVVVEAEAVVDVDWATVLVAVVVVFAVLSSSLSRMTSQSTKPAAMRIAAAEPRPIQRPSRLFRGGSGGAP
jgi:amino acid transporter